MNTDCKLLGEYAYYGTNGTQRIGGTIVAAFANSFGDLILVLLLEDGRLIQRGYSEVTIRM